MTTTLSSNLNLGEIEMDNHLPQAFIEELDTWIHYKTTSDALLSGFISAHQIPPHSIDALLTLLRNPEFEQYKVTFSHTSDVFAESRKYRYDLAIAKLQL